MAGRRIRDTKRVVLRRRVPALSLDLSMVGVSYYAALMLRFEGDIPAPIGWQRFATFVAAAAAAHLVGNLLAGIYGISNKHIGLRQALRVAYTNAWAIALLTILVLLFRRSDHLLPVSVVLVGGPFSLVAMVGWRFYDRIAREGRNRKQAGRRRLLLIGAGQAADMILREIERSRSAEVEVVGFADDSPSLQGLRVHDKPVIGPVDDVPEIVKRHDIDEIIIAVPSAGADELKRIHRICRAAEVPIKTLPRISDIVNGRFTIDDVRELRIEDLLGRGKVETDLAGIGHHIEGRRILITGAAGSIGSELSRQVAGFKPQELVLVDKDESALYYLHEELRSLGRRNYTIVLTSVTLPGKMERVFEEFRPQLVFHAAALKHVPLTELQPDEAVITNIKGTLLVADLAARYGAERVINISTDKAVDPVNVMGATKQAGEKILALLGRRYPATSFTSVRFGNVLLSQGSVIPIFRQQIMAGGPVTVTHPAMTRYFMTISEAVQLVLQAASMVGEATTNDAGTEALSGSGRLVFVLEMGEPVRIVDLARQMIELLGDGTGSDVPIEFVGTRPGEKLHESLFCHDEEPLPTSHPLIYYACSAPLPEAFESDLANLMILAERGADSRQLLKALKKCVPSYEPSGLEQEAGEGLRGDGHLGYPGQPRDGDSLRSLPYLDVELSRNPESDEGFHPSPRLT